MEGRGEDPGSGRPGEQPGEDTTRVQPSTGGASGQQPGPRPGPGPGPGPRDTPRGEPAGRPPEGYAVEEVVEPYGSAEGDELRGRIRRLRGLAVAGLLVGLVAAAVAIIAILAQDSSPSASQRRVA
ncbi:MAG: hypothetical protein ACR2LY_09500, partial [Thermoleophilaceae bacterium]